MYLAVPSMSTSTEYTHTFLYDILFKSFLLSMYTSTVIVGSLLVATVYVLQCLCQCSSLFCYTTSIIDHLYISMRRWEEGKREIILRTWKEKQDIKLDIVGETIICLYRVNLHELLSIYADGDRGEKSSNYLADMLVESIVKGAV